MAGFDVRQEGTLADAAKDIADGIAGVATTTMQEVATGLKTDLRKDVVAAGLGTRLANTWRSMTFPKGRMKSADAAAFVYTKAPDIIDAFSRGVTIVPVNGSKYLAIPTKNVPGKGRGKRMTPLDVENAFNQDLQFGKTKDGRLFAYVEAVKSRNGRAWRQATRGRLNQGRSTQAVVMFFMVPAAKMPKLLDLPVKAQSWAEAAQNLFDQKLNTL